MTTPANPLCPSPLCKTTGQCADPARCTVRGVIKFTTKAERNKVDENAYENAASAEAIRMLEEALEWARNPGPGRKVTGVAIAYTFNDRAYASHIPGQGDNLAGLIAALTDAQYRLMKKTNGDE